MSDWTKIHSDWDADKVAAHLANLEQEAAIEHAIYEAMTNAADEHLGVAYERERQARHCRRLFSKPRTTTEGTTE